MRMITGALLLLTGMIPVTAGMVAKAATWNKTIDIQTGGFSFGAPFLLVGLIVLVWGFVTEGPSKQDS